MSVDWKTLSREAGIAIENGAIRVSCVGNRSQVVHVEVSDAEVVRIWSLVVRRRDAPEDAAVRVWKMNRFRELVGFKVGEHGRIIGESWIPLIGLTAKEWKMHVLTLARACDQLEYQWTGSDTQ